VSVHDAGVEPRPAWTPPVVKCLFVINDLARAGAEKQAALLACGLKALGWSVSVLLIKERNDFSEPLAAAGIPVKSMRRRGPFDLGVVLKLRRVIRETSPDAVVSLLFLANLLTVLASCGLRHRPRIVVSVRASYRYNLSRVERFIARVVHRGADLVLFNSTAALREEQTGLLRVSRVAYLPNAVGAVSTDPVDWRSFGISGGPVVVSVGQFEAVKGHHLLIEAFAAVREAHPDTRLVLVGDGPQEEPLRALVQARGLTDRIVFVGHQRDPLPLVAAADVFVQPSLSEGMSNALMEAMTQGRCIVATKVGAAPDLLEQGVQALLPPPTVPDLVAAIDRALGDPALRARLGEAARKRAGDFSVDRITSELDAILRAVVQRRPIPR
jgi:glycosyltransferase involved in cell wall biosynthesis